MIFVLWFGRLCRKVFASGSGKDSCYSLPFQDIWKKTMMRLKTVHHDEQHARTAYRSVQDNDPPVWTVDWQDMRVMQVWGLKQRVVYIIIQEKRILDFSGCIPFFSNMLQYLSDTMVAQRHKLPLLFERNLSVTTKSSTRLLGVVRLETSSSETRLQNFLLFLPDSWTSVHESWFGWRRLLVERSWRARQKTAGMNFHGTECVTIAAERLIQVGVENGSTSLCRGVTHSVPVISCESYEYGSNGFLKIMKQVGIYLVSSDFSDTGAIFRKTELFSWNTHWGPQIKPLRTTQKCKFSKQWVGLVHDWDRSCFDVDSGTSLGAAIEPTHG